ncbi:MAG: phosphosugar isomerase [Stappiaceae bacterium]
MQKLERDFMKVTGREMAIDNATSQEIFRQPDIWRDWTGDLVAISDEIRRWIKNRRPDVIWLCGAGTSAFIGDSLAVGLDGKIDSIPLRAIPSTDLVARPFDYFKRGLHPLVVSFGRSGNSSESVGTLELIDRLLPTADRLNITCNNTSILANRAPVGPGEGRVVILPEACHDVGFAMTSSYTTMMLTALAIFDDVPSTGIIANLETLANSAADFLNTDFSSGVPHRVVFLGSGPFKGTSRESALKVLELTGGKVVTAWDSTLGFRHGPKAIVDDDTAVFVYLSNECPTRKYDQDMVAEIRQQFPGVVVKTVGAARADSDQPDIQLDGCDSDIWNAALYVVLAQRLAVAWSQALGLNVDDPFHGKNLTRVVSHVRLHT